ncbi:hypothetical protein K438DRAFT_1775206 [Mycena galopus ATCC 62051]|nr:hypothetical protein K438DRAFT_1775206 [Mycena galopus ATCC 62051]
MLANNIREEIEIPPRVERWDDKTQAAVAGLLCCLIHDQTSLAKHHISRILYALSIGGKVADTALVLLFQPSMRIWYEDEDTKHILKNAKVWSSLMAHAQRNVLALGAVLGLFELGHWLLEMSDWQSHISDELSVLIVIFFQQDHFFQKETGQLYSSILGALSDSGDGFPDLNKPLSLSLAALARFWDSFGLSGSDCLHECVQWLRSTCLVVLRDKYAVRWDEVSLDSIKPPCLLPLRNSIINVAAAARQKITNDSGDTATRTKQNLEDIANILEHIATSMTLPNPDKAPIHYEQLREEVLKQIEDLEAAMLTRSHPITLV